LLISLYFLLRYFYTFTSFFTEKKFKKKSQNSRNKRFFSLFLLEDGRIGSRAESGSVLLTNESGFGSGPKTYESGTLLSTVCLLTSRKNKMKILNSFERHAVYI
jgi:hypothetical protein